MKIVFLILICFVVAKGYYLPPKVQKDEFLRNLIMETLVDDIIEETNAENEILRPPPASQFRERERWHMQRGSSW